MRFFFSAEAPRIRNRNSWRPHAQYSCTRSTPPAAAMRSAQTARARFPRRCSSLFSLPELRQPRQLPHRRASHQAQLAGFRNCGAPAQHGISLALNCIQNFLPAAAEEFYVGSQRPIHLCDQRQALVEPFPRPLDFKLHHLAKICRIVAVANGFFTNPKTAQILERKIDSPPDKIRTHVLPEVCQLQGSARVVGEQLAFIISVPAEVEHQVPDRICRILAVAKQLVERLVAAHSLVPPESGQ